MEKAIQDDITKLLDKAKKELKKKNIESANKLFFDAIRKLKNTKIRGEGFVTVVDVAYNAMHNFSDPVLAKKLIVKAINDIADQLDLLVLRSFITDIFVKESSVIEIYNIALRTHKKAWVYCLIAEGVILYFDNMLEAESIYERALKLRNSIADLCLISESVVKKLDRPGWSKDIYKKALKKARSKEDFKLIANSMLEIL